MKTVVLVPENINLHEESSLSYPPLGRRTGRTCLGGRWRQAWRRRRWRQGRQVDGDRHGAGIVCNMEHGVNSGMGRHGMHGMEEVGAFSNTAHACRRRWRSMPLPCRQTPPPLPLPSLFAPPSSHFSSLFLPAHCWRMGRGRGAGRWGRIIGPPQIIIWLKSVAAARRSILKRISAHRS